MDTACSTIDLIMVSARAFLLVICAASGPYMIHLGARMYREAVTQKSSGEVTGMGFKLVLKSAGPGLFLIAFGAGLLVFIVNKQVVLSDEIRAATSATPSGFSTPEVIGRVASALVPPALATEKAPEPEASRKTCIVQVRKREFANGIDPLSRESIVKTLESAIAALRNAQAQGIADPDERAETISGLAALKQATVESP